MAATRSRRLRSSVNVVHRSNLNARSEWPLDASSASRRVTDVWFPRIAFNTGSTLMYRWYSPAMSSRRSRLFIGANGLTYMARGIRPPAHSAGSDSAVPAYDVNACRITTLSLAKSAIAGVKLTFSLYGER